MMSSTNFLKASYVSGSSDGHQCVSSFYSSVENPHYMNQLQYMSMSERIGQFNSGYLVNYSLACLLSVSKAASGGGDSLGNGPRAGGSGSA
jgi:hypothetical protein